MRKVLLLLVLLGLAGGGTYTYMQRNAAPAASYRTGAVKRGDLLVIIKATGTVEPEEVVDVGAQVAGKIEAFGKDPRGNGKVIDYGTPVEEGTVLAHIDDSLYAADVEQATATLESAKASVKRSEADLEQLKAKLIQAERNWKRAKDLGPSRALSATDYDNYEASYLTARASVGVGQAAVVQAQKGVLQAEAALVRYRTNLSYCTIKSPVKGVIVDRRVNIGQTVVASLNAPSLFLIAKDLKKLQVWAPVNEADIGQIRAGQPVTFTVDAYPGQTFHGDVGKVRLNASMTQNVVTYTVEINTDNTTGKLLPYLTANVLFEVDRRKDVLLVPSAALRWKPMSQQQVVPESRGELTGSSRRQKSASQPAGEKGGAASAMRNGVVWVQEGAFVRPIPVKVGDTDNTNTEVESEQLTEGTEVITGEAAKTGPAETTNPFTPQLGGGRRG